MGVDGAITLQISAIQRQLETFEELRMQRIWQRSPPGTIEKMQPPQSLTSEFATGSNPVAGQSKPCRLSYNLLRQRKIIHFGVRSPRSYSDAGVHNSRYDDIERCLSADRHGSALFTTDINRDGLADFAAEIKLVYTFPWCCGLRVPACRD
jgi:hypothetical protein